MKKLCVILSIVFMTLSCVPTFAYGYHGSSHRGDRHYHGGRWYGGHGYRGSDLLGTALAAFTIGAILSSSSQPRNGTYVIINGVSYYYSNGIYYRQIPEDYTIVQTPDPVQDGTAYVINIPNYDGTYTPVVIFKEGNGYRGPQGEFYRTHPTIAELRILYGK